MFPKAVSVWPQHYEELAAVACIPTGSMRLSAWDRLHGSMLSHQAAALIKIWQMFEPQWCTADYRRVSFLFNNHVYQRQDWYRCQANTFLVFFIKLIAHKYTSLVPGTKLALQSFLVVEKTTNVSLQLHKDGEEWRIHSIGFSLLGLRERLHSFLGDASNVIESVKCSDGWRYNQRNELQSREHLRCTGTSKTLHCNVIEMSMMSLYLQIVTNQLLW